MPANRRSSVRSLLLVASAMVAAAMLAPSAHAAKSLACFGTTSLKINPAVKGCPGGGAPVKLESVAFGQAGREFSVGTQANHGANGGPSIVTLTFADEARAAAMKKKRRSGSSISGVAIAQYEPNETKPNQVVVLSDVTISGYQTSSNGARPKTQLQLSAGKVTGTEP